MDFWSLRRYVHVALVLVLIIGVRACGGATQAEDRLSFATRWVAEKAGLTGAKDALDTKVRPPVTNATQSMSYAISATVSRMMDDAEMAAAGTATWVGQQVSNAEAAIATPIRWLLTPNVADEPERPDAPPSDKNLATSSSR